MNIKLLKSIPIFFYFSVFVQWVCEKSNNKLVFASIKWLKIKNSIAGLIAMTDLTFKKKKSVYG